MSRPAVDVVIPFAGPAAALRALADRMAQLSLNAGDTLTIVDNERRTDRPAGVVEAASRRSAYHARNTGARRGSAPWLLFLDADVLAPPDLLDRYFATPPGERAAVLAGDVRDAPGDGAAARYAFLTQAMAQAEGYAQTANCLVRREAFDAVGGFREVRSGGDADLCFRLRDAGWALEPRPAAEVEHVGRPTVRRLLAQRAKHGGGVAWVEGEHPGSFPRRSLPGSAKYAAMRAAQGLAAAARRDRDGALVGLLDGPALLAFELGRRLGQPSP